MNQQTKLKTDEEQSVISLTKEVEGLMQTTSEAQEKITKAQAEINALVIDNDKLTRRCSILEDVNTSSEYQLLTLSRELQISKEEIERLKFQITSDADAHEKSIECLRCSRQEVEAENDQLTSRIAAIQRECDEGRAAFELVSISLEKEREYKQLHTGEIIESISSSESELAVVKRENESLHKSVEAEKKVCFNFVLI